MEIVVLKCIYEEFKVKILYRYKEMLFLCYMKIEKKLSY